MESVLSLVELRKQKEEPLVESRFVLECLNANELGDGLLFTELHRKKFVFNKAIDEWLIWQGHCWRLDVMKEAAAAVEIVADRYLQEATTLYQKMADAKSGNKQEEVARMENIQRRLFQRVSRLRSDAGRQNTLKFAHTNQDPLAISGDEIDQQPWALPCASGVIDLRSGEIWPGRQEDYLFRSSPTEWRGILAPRTVWEKTVLEIFSGRQEIADYFRRLCGYAITGLSTDHVFPILYGRGRNGKTMLVETIADVLGNLAGIIQSEMLLDQGRMRGSSGPTPDIMSLRGMRFVLASETDQGRKISPARVKWLTGGDKLSGRNPYDKFETSFIPTHTIFLLTNNRPHAPADDYAFWQRIHLIPFEVSFVDREPISDFERRRDPKLTEKLKAEYPGILAWLVTGCLEWQRDGLTPPPKIKDATREYQQDEDLLHEWKQDCCVMEPEAETSAKDLYASFQGWFDVTIGGKNCPKQKSFGAMLSRSFGKRRLSGGFVYFGIRLKDEMNDQEDMFTDA